MTSKQWIVGFATTLALVTIVAGCGTSGNPPADNGTSNTSGEDTPFKITLTTAQVGEVPEDGNDVETAIEKYTNTDLEIQWIPNSAYDDKVNIMITSDELSMMLRVKYVPTVINAIQSGLFWEVGPYLKDYKNLAAQNPQYYENISVEGKIYGIPLYRDLSRAATIYRKDWLDNLGMKPPVTLDDWYNVIKAMTLNDPDKNGKNDTYGIVLSKNFIEGNEAATTRLAVAMGAPNKWGVDSNGKFTPEFMDKTWLDVITMFRKLYAEKLINQDFAVLDISEADKIYDSGRAGLRIGVYGNAKSMQERLDKTVANGEFDVQPMTGPSGIRATSDSGNNGFYVFPKSSIKTEDELKRILAFADKMFEEPMATLQRRGFEGKHFKHVDGGKTEYIDFDAFQREIKPYRDTLFNVESFNLAPLKDTPLGEKGSRVPIENLKNAVPNPALTLFSETYSERGRELEMQMNDATVKYIMGQIDEAGWQAEVDKWLKNGGEKIMKEYEEAYAKIKK